MSAGEGWGSDSFDGITVGDGARWGVALLVVLAAGWALGNTMQNLPTPALTVGEPEPAIMIDLMPAVPVTQAEPEPSEVLLPEQAETIQELSPEPVEPIAELPPEPVEPVETVQPAVVEPPSISELQTAEMAEPLAPVESPEEEAVEPIEPLAPEAIESEPVEELAALEDSPLPALPPEEILSAEPEVPLPVAISPQLQERRENTPALSRPVTRQPPATPRQAAGMPAPRAQPTPPAPAVSAASTISPQQWQAQALAQLDRRKIYPPSAQSDGVQGTVDISFSVNASGQVISVGIARSSGSSILDQAAVDTARQASPLPPPPTGYANRSLTATIRFSLR